MAGKPQFDELAVLQAATDVFWRLGYTAASVADLTSATGLSRSSLYQRFHDKDGLFREVLPHYCERVLSHMNRIDGKNARERMYKTLSEFILPVAKSPSSEGCLLARSCAQFNELTPEAQTALREQVDRQRQALFSILEKGLEEGEVDSGADIEALSWFYLGVLHSLVNLPQAGANHDHLRSIIDVSLNCWPAAAISR